MPDITPKPADNPYVKERLDNLLHNHLDEEEQFNAEVAGVPLRRRAAIHSYALQIEAVFFLLESAYRHSLKQSAVIAPDA